MHRFRGSWMLAYAMMTTLLAGFWPSRAQAQSVPVVPVRVEAPTWTRPALVIPRAPSPLLAMAPQDTPSQAGTAPKKKKTLWLVAGAAAIGAGSYLIVEGTKTRYKPCEGWGAVTPGGWGIPCSEIPPTPYAKSGWATAGIVAAGAGVAFLIVGFTR